MCFYSNKEAPRENPGEEKIIENHITNPCVGKCNALGCSTSACPVVSDITAIACRCYRCRIIRSDSMALVGLFVDYIMLGH